MITPEQWFSFPSGVNAVVDFGECELDGITIRMTAIVGPKPPLRREQFFMLAPNVY